MIQWLARAITVCFKSKAQLMAENLCLRQQLVILKRRQPRPCLRDTDRRFWILACRWFAGWGEALIVVQPETVRAECLDHLFIFGYQHLQQSLNEYVDYYNQWRPHRSLGQRAPCKKMVEQIEKSTSQIVAEPVLGGLHHVYRFAA